MFQCFGYITLTIDVKEEKNFQRNIWLASAIIVISSFEVHRVKGGSLISSFQERMRADFGGVAVIRSDLQKWSI